MAAERIEFKVIDSIGRPVKSKVTPGNGVTTISMTLPAVAQIAAASGGGETTSFTNVEILESISYPSNQDVSKYTVTTSVGEPSSAEEIEIDSVLGYGTGLDMRDFTPWLQVGQVVPIITIDSVVYFLQTFSYVGDSTARSLAWLEDIDAGENTPRTAAVFR